MCPKRADSRSFLRTAAPLAAAAVAAAAEPRPTLIAMPPPSKVDAATTQLRDCFLLLDTDKDGLVSASDAAAGLWALGYLVEEERLLDWMDRRGACALEDFEQLARRAHEALPQTQKKLLQSLEVLHSNDIAQGRRLCEAITLLLDFSPAETEVLLTALFRADGPAGYHFEELRQWLEDPLAAGAGGAAASSFARK